MKKLALLFFAITIFHSAFADTFIVTSNADSGPLTLREAITMANANGTAATDYIYFNIAGTSEAGRTISLMSELPSISSNITIDASMQPGVPFDISTAKIILFLDHYPPSSFTFLFINNSSNVSVYGLCFKYFESPDAVGGMNYAIGLRNSKNITVGAPGKGNLFSSVQFSVSNNYQDYYTDSVSNVTIQSNVFGLFSRNVGRGSIDLVRASGITIGGSNPDQGNVFVSASVRLSETANTNTDFFAKIQNNKFNMDWTGSRYYRGGGQIALSGNITDDTTTTKTFVLDNVVASDWPGGISLTQIYHKAIVQGNKLGTDITGTICKGGDPNDLSFYDCKKVIVGGYDAGEDNIISGTIYSQAKGVNIIKGKFGLISISGNYKEGDPFIKIISYDNGLITGKSNPGSKIQLYTNTCDNFCINRVYLSSVNADNLGDWSFPYTSAMPNIVATATNKDSSTSMFSAPKMDHYTQRIITNATCGKNNGSITGIIVTEGTHIVWRDSYTLKIISTDTNLINAPPGSYVFSVSNGANGCQLSTNLDIIDISPPGAVDVTINNSTCGQNDGILRLEDNYGLSYLWMNANHDSVGTGIFANLLAPGRYYLKARVSYDTSCNKIYGPYEVKNTSGAFLNIDKIKITPSTCSKSNGSIKGVTALNFTGTPFIQWLDSLDAPVGDKLDLLNILPGKYRLKFKDETGCDTIITPYYTVGNNGNILIDISDKLVSASKCSGVSGSIQQLKVTGGEVFQWIRTSDNAIVGSSVNVFNLAPGNYQLKVANQFGCKNESPVINVPQATFNLITVTNFTSKNALCGKEIGSININSFDADSKNYTFRWVDSTSNQTIGAGITLNNLKQGGYQLFATDSNGCEKKIFNTHISSSAIPYFDYSQVIAKNDNCNLNEGSISNLKVNGLKGPTTFTWHDASNKIVGNNIFLQNTGAGSYVLKITDDGICNVQSQPFVITNSNKSIVAPSYQDLIIPRNTDAAIVIRNAAPGDYKLSKDSKGSTILQQNDNGNFIIPKIAADTGFYVQFTLGSCSAPIVRINIKVVDKSFFAIPTAFTPNNDGLNDRLPVSVIGFIDLEYFRIYNRWGELVYQTQRINDSWDGNYKGTIQNMGAFVWIAKGKDIKGNVVTDKGSFILVR
ncbi:MAG: gliding motility-associated C-terminal domain-containing protein [Ginsengibacter sp.]